ncbi:MAG: YhfZ family protein [Clostridia bacterium]|nr:YhfZ family protein [Clostridia bacterium]
MIHPINKQQLVCERIARALLVMHLEGKDRMPSVKQFAESYGVGTGTVQGAFQNLKDSGAIELNACGASGTYLVSVDQRKLFDVCNYGEIICLMPLGANACLRGLATGIYESVSEKKLPIHILFARGSRNRVNMIKREKCDLTVMSRLAYETALSAGETEIELIGEIGRCPGGIGCITREGVPFEYGKTKVAFDRYSYDHRAINTLLKLPFAGRDDCLDVQLADMVRVGEVEAALCERSSLGDGRGLDFHELTALPQQAQDKLRRAVLVARRGEESLIQLLRLAITPEKVAKIQDEVMNGRRFEKY